MTKPAGKANIVGFRTTVDIVSVLTDQPEMSTPIRDQADAAAETRRAGFPDVSLSKTAPATHF
jgi:hypothetical protein